MEDKLKVSEPLSETTSRSKNEMEYCATISRWILRSIGIWPSERQANIIEEIITETRVLICYFLIFFLLIPCVLHTFLDEKDPRKKLKLFGPIIFYSTGVTKYSFLVARREDIRKCMDHMFADRQQSSSSTDRKIMSTSAKISRFIASICTILSYSSAVFIRLVIPLSMGKRITADNITVRPFGSPVYKPLFDAVESPFYEIVFTTQTISAFILYSITVGTCSLASVFVLHACGQLQIIMNRIKSFVDESGCVQDIFENQMTEMVEHHSRTLRFIKSVEVTLNEVCLVEFLGCIIEICLIGYYLLTELQRAETLGIITYCVLLASFTFNIFIFCYIGEMLTQQGIELSVTANMIEWYKLPGKSARDLVLLLVMMSYPCNITAGKIAGLSYKSFADVLKTSVGYFNLLRKVVS